MSTTLTAADIAVSALDELIQRSNQFRKYAITERDTNARLGTVSPPYLSRDVVHAFVLTESAPRGIAVPLDRTLNMSISVRFKDLCQSPAWFEHMHMAPAMQAFAEKLDYEVAKFARANEGGDPIALASAPLPIGFPCIPPEHEAVATCEGVSLRAVMQYDIGKMREVISLDVLYGLRVIEGAA
ncbi:hypothetical protein GS502_11160 [Rhodococcus hoagii]|nr:hypothetical protein [Prescottella equi]